MSTFSSQLKAAFFSISLPPSIYITLHLSPFIQFCCAPSPSFFLSIFFLFSTCFFLFSFFFDLFICSLHALSCSCFSLSVFSVFIHVSSVLICGMSHGGSLIVRCLPREQEIMIIIIIMMIIIVITLKGTIQDICNLLTAPRIVSNMCAQMAQAQSCANHEQYFEHLSCVTCCMPLDMKVQLSY